MSSAPPAPPSSPGERSTASSTRARLFGRRNRTEGSSTHHDDDGEEPEPYVPPSMDSGFEEQQSPRSPSSPTPATGEGGSGFVTQPPKLVAKGLTGKISTLFRRESTRGGGADSGTAGADPAAASPPRRRRSLSRPRFAGQQRVTSLSPRSMASSVDPAGLTPPGRSHSSVTSSRPHSPAPPPPRLFYSSHADDSDDSYESRVSQARSRRSKKSKKPKPTSSSRSRSAASPGEDHLYSEDDTYDPLDDDEDDEYSDDDGTGLRILRYRGFSTSIKSLFLDEALVCASMGCFGLLLSNRTEYLLALRNSRRGTLSSRNGDRRHKLPSKVVAYGLILTVLLMFTTFLVFGFGTGHGLATDYYKGYDYYDASGIDDANSNNNANAADDANNNNNNYGDDANGAAQNGGDDAQQQGAQNDDANANANQDDGNNNNLGDDDGGQQVGNDDGGAAAAADDGNNNNRRDRTRRRQTERWGPGSAKGTTNWPYREAPHPVHGIFKLRDVQENVWGPVWDLVQAEWYRDDEYLVHGGGYDQYENYDHKNDAHNASLSGARHRHNRRRARDQTSYYDVVDDTVHEVEYTKLQRDIGSNIRTVLLFSFLLFLGILGRRRRMRTRFYLVRARAQEDHLYYASSNVGSGKSHSNPGSPTSLDPANTASYDGPSDASRENQYEGACSHTLCGCYPVDEAIDDDDDAKHPANEEVQVQDTGIFRLKRKPHHEDVVARGFNCCMAACCGVLCKCWFQCLSVCALAQEAREIRLLVPTRYQRIDFITHQPFHEYHRTVTDLRLGWMGKTRRVSGILPHYNALSRLSRYIVVTGTVAITAIVATLMFNPRAAFSWQDAVVLAATFLQSFAVLFVVHWIFHKSDLSLDAVIKLFAAGFLIAVPSAFFFEGLVVNVVLLLGWGVYSIFDLAVGEPFSDFMEDHWRVVWILCEVFNAYVVAALTEELCKYYTFRAVEHPDLVFLTGLNRDGPGGEGTVVGGVVRYPFGAHQVSELNRDMEDDNMSQRSGKSHRSNVRRGRYSTSSGRGLGDDLIDGNDKDEFKLEEADVRTHRQRAMAITTGMISVAVGLGCAENMLYVFVLGGALGNDKGEEHREGEIMEAWILLFFRSIFPIHALAAAMQSVNMIRKFVETSEQSGHRIGVGRIILPAVVLHGSFDAFLMAVNVISEYIEYSDYAEGEDSSYSSLVLNIVACIGITAIMLLGILWYFRANRLQRQRLKDLEEKDKAKWPQGGGGEGAQSPASTAELV